LVVAGSVSRIVFGRATENCGSKSNAIFTPKSRSVETDVPGTPAQILPHIRPNSTGQERNNLFWHA
jgi:hypothetical protein